MKLYRIRKKETGQFFVGWIAPWHPKHKGKVNWSVTGVFFRNIDTVIKHLEMLSSDWTYPDRDWRHDGYKGIITKHYPERLDLYQVVVNDVEVLSENILEANKLLIKEKVV